MKRYHFLVASFLALSPATTVFAQQTTSPDLKANSTREAESIKNGSAASPSRPGGTGMTTVPGDKSTIAGDQKATDRAKSGGGGGGGK